MKKEKNRYFSFTIFITLFVCVVVINIVNVNILYPYMNFIHIPTGVSVLIALFWMATAAMMTVAIRYNTVKHYEKPLKMFARATAKVASGDFSVYVEPVHRPDKQDYLDFMINDFNKMVEELGSVETLKTDFFSNVSHEIKTPLAVIHNYAQLLQDENLPREKRVEYANAISDSSRRMSNLITNILRLNKLEKQTISANQSAYDLCRQLEKCILSFEQLWDEKDIEIDVDIQDSCIINSDRELLEIVWNNLMSNAVKFTPAGGSIALKQHVADGNCVVSIQDSGIGMDEKTLKHIFDKFYQGDTSHSSRGNGLGLALVKRILHITGADISVSSTPGKGSTFTVTIPLAPQQ